MSTIQARGSDRYRDAGVDIDAGNAFVERIKPLAAKTRRPGAEAALGGFGALFDLRAAGFVDPLLVTTTDGVGTKLLLGLETGRLEGLGVDLVAMCVNDLVVQGAAPLLFLDYLATGRLDVEAAARIVTGIAAACEESGCALVGGETAEMPGLYAPGHMDLAGFALGAVERGSVLPRPDVVAGDVVLGLASSGVHSNGFSLVRLGLAESGADLAAEAPFEAGRSLAEALLTPTRLYVRAGLAAAATGMVKAMAHITGGGLVENLPRVLPVDMAAELDPASWTVPPVFDWLARATGADASSMARTFNLGIGLVLVVADESVDRVEAALRGAGERPLRIGRIVPTAGGARVRRPGEEGPWTAPSSPS